ncbi:glycoside hydrolase, partial [Basidiobolus meristosporus CBS 931.73]
GVPGTVPKNSYNVVNLAFWLSYGAYDAAYTWTQLDSATRKSYIDAFHAAGVNVLVSAFGAAEWPVTSYKDPVATANNLATFIKTYGLDGADIDWEDNNAMSAGTGEKWLITFQNTLRAALPSPYIITHAPQAPYFFVNTKQYPNGAYNAVHKAVGSTIDWYNVQFYNQGTTKYDTCDTLLNKADGFFNGTSLFEIANNGYGIPANKIIIGKPVTPAGATNTGYMDVSLLATCLKQAKTKGWNGGAMVSIY